MIADALLQDVPARIAILGPGGMGKSSLALLTLHNFQIITKFGQHRYFIACDSATSGTDLISLITNYFGLSKDVKMHTAIVRYFSSIQEPILLILDNLETPWEPSQHRPVVEEFLSLLTALNHLHLIVCFYFLLFKVFYDANPTSDHHARY